jgi:hypothetical protein
MNTQMFREPTVRAVFENKIELLFPGLNSNSSKIAPDNDPVYREITMLHHQNPGLAGELYAMRLFMRLSLDPRSLYDSLDCEKSGISRESIVSHVRFAEIVTCGTAKELEVSELEFMLNPSIKYLFYLFRSHSFLFLSFF